MERVRACLRLRRWTCGIKETGQSLSEIVRALDKGVGSIHGVMSSNGGFIPAAVGFALGADALGARRDFVWPGVGSSV
jgi:hypothetical protein